MKRIAMTQHSIQIELEGLITLLAQNLYAEPDVFLREMLQNAHDSISKRRELAARRGESQVPDGEIRIVIDAEAHTLAIIDNGSGLTELEIHDYLATIGRSGTDELRQRLRSSNEVRDTAVQLIGQFGIGLLSAFIVADEVQVLTRAPGHAAYRWVSTGSRSYTVESAKKIEIGTMVTLRIGPKKLRYLEPERIVRIVRTYADFLGVPVYLQGDRANKFVDTPMNAVNAPWHDADVVARDAETRQRAAVRYWETRFPGEVTLDVRPLAEAFSYVDPEQPDTPFTGVVHGVLAITDRHVPDVNSRGTVDLYVSRMFICAGHRDVLPPWARFIQGVIECEQLTPNAARDNVVRNAALQAVQQTLGRVIIDWLSALSQDDSDRFARIMRWHSYHILGMSVQDAHGEFFRAVADLVPLQSDRGTITIPAYLQATRDAVSANLAASANANADAGRGPAPVYYITEVGSARQYYMLCAARGLCVFDCAEPFAERFLTRYAATWPERIELCRLDLASSEAIFEPLSDADSQRFANLVSAVERLFADGSVTARAERFAPIEVPAVITEARDAKSRRQMAGLIENPTVPAFLRDMVTDFLSDRRDPVTLHLNADNPTVIRLCDNDLEQEVARLSLLTLYNNAMMLSARTLSADATRVMFDQYNRLIELLLQQRTQLAEVSS